MVDTKDLKSFGHCGCAGSSPAPSTKPITPGGWLFYARTAAALQREAIKNTDNTDKTELARPEAVWFRLAGGVAAANRRSVASAPPPKAETMTRGEVFRHPGRWWQPCVAGYFADRGVGDMPGAAMTHI